MAAVATVGIIAADVLSRLTARSAGSRRTGVLGLRAGVVVTRSWRSCCGRRTPRTTGPGRSPSSSAASCRRSSSPASPCG